MAALRIVWDVAVYRLRRLEMANLVAAGAVVLALRSPPDQIALRMAFGVVLNLLVYLNNDFHDAEEDAGAASKDATKTAYLLAHRGAAIVAQVVMVGILAAVAMLFERGLLIPLLVGGGVCWAYSAVLKRHPAVDVIAMVIWGVSMPSVAFAPEDLRGWALVGILGLFSGAFETVQVIRDEAEDRAAGVRTTAVALGVARSWWLARFFILASAVYGVLVIHPLFGAAPILALLIPRTEPTRYWNALRLVLGLCFLGACGQVWIYGDVVGLALR